MTEPARIVAGLALLVGLPAYAQIAPNLSPSLPTFSPAPVPVGPDGKPIPTYEPTEADRKEEARRREESERQAETAKRAAELERRNADLERQAAEQLVEQQRFHNRIMTAVYVGLAILAVFVVAVLRKSAGGS